MDKKINPEIDTTRFVNISNEKFTFHINKQPREVEAGEEKIMPVYVAQIGAKHLVDLVLQKSGVSDTLRDTPSRRNLFAKILPDMAEERNIVPLSPDQEKEELKKEVARQKDVVDSILKSKNADDERDKKIAELEEKLAKLIAAPKEEPKKAGRPPKVKEE